MINNSTKNYKMNNYVSTQIMEHKKKIMTYANWNQGPSLGQAQTCGTFKPVNRPQC